MTPERPVEIVADPLPDRRDVVDELARHLAALEQEETTLRGLEDVGIENLGLVGHAPTVDVDQAVPEELLETPSIEERRILGIRVKEKSDQGICRQ